MLWNILGLLPCEVFTSVACQADAASLFSPRPAPDMLVSVFAIWPPFPPMMLEHVSDSGHRSGKWTSGAPVQRRTHSQVLHISLFRGSALRSGTCTCLMIWWSCVLKLGITETWLLAHQPTGRPYGWKLERCALLCTRSSVQPPIPNLPKFPSSTSHSCWLVRSF